MQRNLQTDPGSQNSRPDARQLLEADESIELAAVLESSYDVNFDLQGLDATLESGTRGLRVGAQTTAVDPDDQYWDIKSTGLQGTVAAMTVYGGALYAGGAFTTDGSGNSCKRVARWNGNQWIQVGPGLNNVVYSLTVFNGELYAGGAFDKDGDGNNRRFIARWDAGQNAWQKLTKEIQGGWAVYALAVYNGDLIAAGSFIHAGNQSDVNNIARWDGADWHDLGGGMTGSTGFRTAVNALCVLNGTLFAGGDFRFSGANPCRFVAEWDAGGEQWDELGSGMNGHVNTITGYGCELYVGGDFTMENGGNGYNYVARWDGQWNPLGPGLDDWVAVIFPFHNELVVGGLFEDTANGSGNNFTYVSRWDPDSLKWSSLGQGTNSTVFSLTQYSGGCELIVGGAFTMAGGSGAKAVASWSKPSSKCPLLTEGSVNIDCVVSSADIITMVNYVFKSGPEPIPCPAAADVNCDGSVASSDIIHEVNFVFKSGPPPCNICQLVEDGIWDCGCAP